MRWPIVLVLLSSCGPSPIMWSHGDECCYDDADVGVTVCLVGRAEEIPIVPLVMSEAFRLQRRGLVSTSQDNDGTFRVMVTELGERLLDVTRDGLPVAGSVCGLP